MTATHRRCPACASSRTHPVHRLALRTPDGHPMGSGYEVVACVTCGTGFADVDVSQAFYDRYYADSAKYAAEAATSDGAGAAAEPAWKAARLDDAAGRIVDLLPTDARTRVLDIGCANGTLLAALRRHGVLDVRGVDPSPGSAAAAAAHHGVLVQVGTLSNLPAGLGLFDCVCLTGVLEHVLDIETAMHAVLSVLRPGGFVYLDLPDASRYLDPYIAPFEDFSTEHVNHFSPTTLTTLARRFGLEAVSTERFVTDLAEGVRCAAIRAVWRRPEAPEARAGTGAAWAEAPTADHSLPDVLRTFAARSQADFDLIDAGLCRALAGDRRFAVWGAGELTLKLLATPALAGRTLVAVVDGNPARHGARFGPVTVGGADSVPADVPIVIGSLLSEPSIRAAITARALPNPVIGLRAGRSA